MELTKELWDMLVGSLAEIKGNIHSLDLKIDEIATNANRQPEKCLRDFEGKFANKECEKVAYATDKKVTAAIAVISFVVVVMGLYIKFL